ncbi:MAG TPA: response regulator transcription factor [Chloroflexota bacterium]|jgi:DNA-binding response OmpR family regulator
MPTVLVVDDDPRLRHLVEILLRGNGFRVEAADDGDVLVSTVRRVQPDLVLLDLKMERLGGLEALRALRAAEDEVPVIILSAAGEESLVLQAFEAGADDYITKPFLVRVLLARIGAVLKRARRAAPAAAGAGAVLTLDPLTHSARVGGRAVSLSPKEYQLLRILVRGAGHVFTASELLEQVWGSEYAGQDEIVRANIYRLRQKLEPEPGEPRYILGRRGVGYYVLGAENSD